MKSILIVVSIITVVACYFIADLELTPFQSRYLSIVGTACTLVGLIYTIIQVSLVRRESEVISLSASETKEQVLLLARVADWARGIKVAQEIQNHCRNGKREIAIPRIQELKQILHDIVNSSDEKLKNLHGSDAGKQIVSLNVVINGFEKDSATKMSGDEVASVNKMLESTIDLLSRIQSIAKNKG